jgi:predicted ATPase
LSALVGREQEIREVAEATDTHRIVTLTGVGGVGKTRLAIAVAEARTQVYVEGVVFVDLEPVRSPDLLIDSVAHAMELTINSQQQASSEAIYEALALQRMLLLLDNCEHLVERCRALVQSVLGRCPFVHVLCTSRQPLEITGEHIVTVPPLAVPPEPAEYSDKQQSNPEELLGYGAVALLAERASVGAERFQVTARNAAAVARICRRLDGLPLALELAATHLRHETPAAIAAQMDDRFHPLLRSRKHPLPRHRTLESVIGWSYEGLADNQRRQLNRLSVFRGPFGVSAVESVCGSSSNGAAGTLSGSDTTLLLEFLAARSLVMCEGKGDVARYHLLGSIREFAWDRLHESGEAQRVRSRHRDYFVDFAEHARTFFDGPQQAFWYAQLEREHDNLRAALEWCAAGDEEGAKTGLRLAAALWEFWNVRGYGREGLKLLQEILTWEGAKAPTEQRANALNGAGVLSVIRHDFMAAHRFLEESLHIWRDLGSAQIVHTLQSLGFLASEEGNLAVAKGLYEEALRLARSDGNRRFTLYPLQGLADVAHRQGDLLTARACYEESIAIAREFGDQGGLVWALNGLADVSSQLGDADAALAMQEEKSAIARQLQAPGVLIDALVQLGYQALIQGQYARARSLYEQRLEAAKDAQAIQQIGWGYYDLGVLAAYQSDYGRAHDLFQETLLLFGQAGLAKEEEFALPWAQAQITWYASWQKGHDRNAELRSVLEKTLTLFQTVDSTLAIPWVKCYLAWVVQDEGDCSLAGALLREALSSRSGFRDQERLIWCLFGLGRNLRARGQIAQTVRLLGALESALERIGFVLPQAIQEEREKLIADVRALVGSAEAPSLWSEGKAMTQEEAITYALKEAA